MTLRDGRDDAVSSAQTRNGRDDVAGTGDGPRSDAAAERVAAADTVSPADTLLADAKAWLDQDPDDETRAELSVLLA
ncbi:MAG: hypothetical protein M3116_01775, partial [Actinomycetota bacterium]|nr:hypothetical protein [Actinomycetota bacterium]